MKIFGGFSKKAQQVVDKLHAQRFEFLITLHKLEPWPAGNRAVRAAEWRMEMHFLCRCTVVGRGSSDSSSPWCCVGSHRVAARQEEAWGHPISIRLHQRGQTWPCGALQREVRDDCNALQGAVQARGHASGSVLWVHRCTLRG